jgi:hypothetical protein
MNAEIPREGTACNVNLKGSNDSELHCVLLFLSTLSIVQYINSEVTKFRQLAILPSSAGPDKKVKVKGKVVLLHAMEALRVTGGIAPTLS